MHYNNTSDIQSDCVTLASENGRHQDPQMRVLKLIQRHFRVQTYINIDNTLFTYTSDILWGFMVVRITGGPRTELTLGPREVDKYIVGLQ